MADYCGDALEDCAMNEALTKHMYAPDEELVGVEQFVAIDYFKWGWEAAMEFAKGEQNDKA